MHETVARPGWLIISLTAIGLALGVGCSAPAITVSRGGAGMPVTVRAYGVASTGSSLRLAVGSADLAAKVRCVEAFAGFHFTTYRDGRVRVAQSELDGGLTDAVVVARDLWRTARGELLVTTLTAPTGPNLRRDAAKALRDAPVYTVRMSVPATPLALASVGLKAVQAVVGRDGPLHDLKAGHAWVVRVTPGIQLPDDAGTDKPQGRYLTGVYATSPDTQTVIVEVEVVVREGYTPPPPRRPRPAPTPPAVAPPAPAQPAAPGSTPPPSAPAQPEQPEQPTGPASGESSAASGTAPAGPALVAGLGFAFPVAATGPIEAPDAASAGKAAWQLARLVREGFAYDLDRAEVTPLGDGAQTGATRLADRRVIGPGGQALVLATWTASVTKADPWPDNSQARAVSVEVDLREHAAALAALPRLLALEAIDRDLAAGGPRRGQAWFGRSLTWSFDAEALTLRLSATAYFPPRR